MSLTNILKNAVKIFQCSGVCLLISCVTITNALAQNLVLVKTQTGCSFYSNPATAEALKKIQDIKLNWHWDGECIGGLAQDMGTSKLEYTAQYLDGGHSTRQHYHAGYPVGYGKYTFRSKTFSSQSWVFNSQDKVVGFNGLGLVGGEGLLSATTVLLPEENAGVIQKNQMLQAPTSGITMMGAHCGLHKSRFPDCGFGEGRVNTTSFMCWKCHKRAMA